MRRALSWAALAALSAALLTFPYWSTGWESSRFATTVLRELMPLLEGEPEAAFFLRPEKAEPKRKSATTKESGGIRAGAKAKGRASPNGEPKAQRSRSPD